MHHLIHLKKVGLIEGKAITIPSQDPPIVGNIGVNNDQSQLGVQMARALHQTWQACDITIDESMMKTTRENPLNLGTKLKLDKNLEGDEANINIRGVDDPHFLKIMQITKCHCMKILTFLD
jgi:hypothetical protein